MSRMLRRRMTSSDEGFTLIELSVAMFLTLVALTALIAIFLGSIKSVALSKQRQAANGLATAVLEQFRAVDYPTLSAGLSCTDLAGDSNLTTTGTCGAAGGTVTLTANGLNETVQVQSSTPAASIPPLYPHRQTKTIENVTYSVSAYVTQSGTTEISYNLSVLVSWSSGVSKGTKTVIQRSLEFSPSRCLSAATHPYSGACQAAFNGDAGLSNASIKVITPTGDGSDIPGFAGSSVELGLPNLSSTLGVEQVTKLTGSAQTTEVATKSATPESRGGVTAAVAADTDPSSSTGGSQSATASQSSGSTPTLLGTIGTLSGTPLTGDTGSTSVAVSSTATSCIDAVGTAIAGAATRPCSSGQTQAAGTAGTIDLNLNGGAPSWTLASVAAAPTVARSVVGRTATAGGTACPTTSGVGCVTAQATRTLGTVALGNLPTTQPGDIAPTGWTGSMITVTGVAEKAYAEAGIGRRVPSFQRTGGSLSYYNPATTTYQTVNLSTLVSDFSTTLPAVSGTYTKGGHTLKITMSTTLRAGAPKPVTPSLDESDATCKSKACTASATPTSTLLATISYTIVMDGAPATSTSFAVVADLGALVARSSYKAAFDA